MILSGQLITEGWLWGFGCKYLLFVNSAINQEHPEEFDAAESEDEKEPEPDNDVEMDVDSSSEDEDFTTKLQKAKVR